MNKDKTGTRFYPCMCKSQDFDDFDEKIKKDMKKRSDK